MQCNFGEQECFSLLADGHLVNVTTYYYYHYLKLSAVIATYVKRCYLNNEVIDILTEMIELMQ